MARIGRSLLLVAGVLATLAAFCSCKRETTSVTDSGALAPSPSSEQKTSGDASQAQTLGSVREKVVSKTSGSPPPAELWKEFSGERAFAEVRKQVEIGPRPSGSPELEKARVHITEVLQDQGWEITRQEFTDTTPRGPLKFTNLIARFGAGGARPAPANTQRAIVCSHYDTKRFSTISFLGASDGASSTGALLELGRVLALNPALAARIELVFFDGEEALTQFTETDGLYGSRYYARQLRETGRAPQFQFGILWDMIGDKDLTITLSPDSPPELTKAVLAAASTLGLRDRFSFFDRQIYDDHVPLNVAGIPTIDLIDFDYLPWHTADDTLDKLSPASLQIIGAVTLLHLQQALAK